MPIEALNQPEELSKPKNDDASPLRPKSKSAFADWCWTRYHQYGCKLKKVVLKDCQVDWTSTGCFKLEPAGDSGGARIVHVDSGVEA